MPPVSVARGPGFDASRPVRRLCIVGGGFTGVAVAVHVALGARQPLEVVIVEPRRQLGGGVAYSSTDPAHRTNVPASRMSLFTSDDGHFGRWLAATGALRDDPEAERPDGRVYPRRGTFGRYVAATLDAVAMAGRVRVSHRLDRAVELTHGPSGWRVGLADGEALMADAVVLAVSHPPPAPSPLLVERLGAHPKFVPDPWQAGALNPIESTDSVVIMGTALSMADVVASLTMRGHRGPILAFSRRGLLSRPQSPVPHEPVGDFTRDALGTAHGLVRRIRREIAEGARRGVPWQAVVDAVRRDGREVWRRLDDGQRALLLRHVRPYWEVHRYRVAPQVHDVIERRRGDGTLDVVAARLASVAVTGDRIECELRLRGERHGTGRRIAADAFVLTTGPGHGDALRSNPALRSLADAGWIAPDRFGLGLAVDDRHRALSASGLPAPNLLVAGPLARATFGELMGLPQVTRSAEEVAGEVLALAAERTAVRAGDRVVRQIPAPVPPGPTRAHPDLLPVEVKQRRVSQQSAAFAAPTERKTSMFQPSVLGIAGSVRQPSRTANLVAAVVDAIALRLGTVGQTIELGDGGTSFFDALQRDAMAGRARDIIAAIEEADVLVVGTPVYRASYTGLFKHVFDLVHHEALVGKTVVLTATGGSPLHGLVMEHQLRPLFGFFRAHTVPSAVYATEADFDQYTLTSPVVIERIHRATEEVARLVAPDRSPILERHSAGIAAVA